MDLHDRLAKLVEDDSDGAIGSVVAMRGGQEDPALPATDIPMVAQDRLKPEAPQEPEHLRDFWQGLPVDHKQELFDHYHANNPQSSSAPQKPAPEAPLDLPSPEFETERTLHGLLIREVR